MRGRDGNIHRGRPTEGMPAMISHLGALDLGGGRHADGPAPEGGLERRGRRDLHRRRRDLHRGLPRGPQPGGGREAAAGAGGRQQPVRLLDAQRAPVRLRRAVDRAVGYGVGGHEVDGTDMLACIEVMRPGRAPSARAGDGPQMVVASTCCASAATASTTTRSTCPTNLRSSPLGARLHGGRGTADPRGRIRHRGGDRGLAKTPPRRTCRRRWPRPSGSPGPTRIRGRLGSRYSTPGLSGRPLRIRPMSRVTYIDAIREAQHDLLRAGQRVFIYGQDIGRFGGAFKATQGLPRGVSRPGHRRADQRGRHDRHGDRRRHRGHAPDRRNAVRGFLVRRASTRSSTRPPPISTAPACRSRSRCACPPAAPRARARSTARAWRRSTPTTRAWWCVTPATVADAYSMLRRGGGSSTTR